MGKEDLKSMELNDMELENVNGGSKKNEPEPLDTKKALCPNCKEERVFNLYSGGRAICQKCGKQIFM